MKRCRRCRIERDEGKQSEKINGKVINVCGNEMKEDEDVGGEGEGIRKRGKEWEEEDACVLKKIQA